MSISFGFTIIPERSGDAPAIEALLDLCFGADRRRKCSYAYRDGVESVLSGPTRQGLAKRRTPLRPNDQRNVVISFIDIRAIRARSFQPLLVRFLNSFRR